LKHKAKAGVAGEAHEGAVGAVPRAGLGAGQVGVQWQLNGGVGEVVGIGLVGYFKGLAKVGFAQ
jgi:hypothetical protein